MRAFFALEPNRVLGLLIQLRFVAVALYCAALIWLHATGNSAPLVLWLLPAALLTFNIFCWWRLAEHASATPWRVDRQLALDTLALFVLLWATGGAANPFVSLILVPVALASVALPTRHAAAIAVGCVLAYTVLLLRYLEHAGAHAGMMGFERHVIGMWLNFVLATLLLSVFLLALASTLRNRERELAAQRERLLRDDAIVSVATLAAGAAHALNTPLNTIVLAAESLADNPELAVSARADAEIISEQATLCAQQLRRLVESQPSAADRGQLLPDFAAAVIDRWRVRRPEIESENTGTHELPALMLRDDPALAQALLNLLDNAADASLAADNAGISINWRHESGPDVLHVTIDDEGNAADTEALNRRPMPSGKSDGLGLGLTLARASILRVGGRVTFARAPGGGIRTGVRLPLVALAGDTAGDIDSQAVRPVAEWARGYVA